MRRVQDLRSQERRFPSAGLARAHDGGREAAARFGPAATGDSPSATDAEQRNQRRAKLDDQIGAVRIAVPDPMPFPIAMAALALGKHGFVEKPLAHTVQEARTLAWVAAPPMGVLGASCRGASQV